MFPRFDIPLFYTVKNLILLKNPVLVTMGSMWMCDEEAFSWLGFGKCERGRGFICS